MGSRSNQTTTTTAVTPSLVRKNRVLKRKLINIRTQNCRLKKKLFHHPNDEEKLHEIFKGNPNLHYSNQGAIRSTCQHADGSIFRFPKVNCSDTVLSRKEGLQVRLSWTAVAKAHKWQRLTALFNFRTLQLLGFKLPSISSIRNWMHAIPLMNWINHKLLLCLKDSISHLNNYERNAILMWDEMRIKHVEYDKSRDKLFGIHDHG